MLLRVMSFLLATLSAITLVLSFLIAAPDDYAASLYSMAAAMFGLALAYNVWQANEELKKEEEFYEKQRDLED